MTAAVTEAVRERLGRVRKRSRTGMASRLLRFGADCAAHLPKEALTVDHGEMLCDTKGLAH